MPNALVEASAAGLPIVTSNIGGADDIVVHNKTGFICEEHDIKSYCNYISSLIDNYQMRKDFGVAANKNTVEKFDIAKLSYVHNDFYGKFLTLVNRLSL
jgi:glycosyltransferase involved in cell wall biosynthesis